MPASVDRIMTDLRREVHKYVLVDEQEAQRTGGPSGVSRLRRVQWVNSHLPIGWPVMPRNPIQKAICIAQKVTRRLLRWYINPIVDQQNRFNEAATNTLAEQQKAIAAAEERAQALQEELETAWRNIEALRREMVALRGEPHER
jgi:hypothetical protein